MTPGTIGHQLPPDPVLFVLQRHSTLDHKIYPMANHPSTLQEVQAGCA